MEKATDQQAPLAGEIAHRHMVLELLAGQTRMPSLHVLALCLAFWAPLALVPSLVPSLVLSLVPALVPSRVLLLLPRLPARAFHKLCWMLQPSSARMCKLGLLLSFSATWASLGWTRRWPWRPQTSWGVTSVSVACRHRHQLGCHPQGCQLRCRQLGCQLLGCHYQELDQIWAA